MANQKTINLCVQQLDIEVTFKKMKNIYLKVKPNGDILVSAPIGTRRDHLVQFISGREEWIREKLEILKERGSHAKKLGTNEILLFGKPITGDFTDKELQNALEEKIKVFTNKYWSFFARRGLAMPQIKYRAMKSTWGVCRPVANTITYNKLLVHQPPVFVEYVVLHELCHLIEANHSKKFYALVGLHMPDFRSAEKMRINFI